MKQLHRLQFDQSKRLIQKSDPQAKLKADQYHRLVQRSNQIKSNQFKIIRGQIPVVPN